MIAQIERAACQHLGRRRAANGLTDLADRSSHPCAILHGLVTWLERLQRPPRQTVATEAWPPNVGVAAARLRPLGVAVIQVEGASSRS